MNWCDLEHPFIRSSPRTRDIYSCCRSFGTETVTTCYLVFFTARIQTVNLPHSWQTFFPTEKEGDLTKDLISFTKTIKN